MQQFLDKLDLYAKVSSLIVKGEKIIARDYKATLIESLDKLAARMYTGFFSPLEPQSLIQQEGWTDDQIQDMGQTNSHPLMSGLSKETKATMAVNPGVYVIGSMSVGRSVTALSGRVGSPVPSILAKGDFVALAEATAEMKYRLKHKKEAPFPPLVIQEPAFWGNLFEFDPVVAKDLQGVGIFLSKDVDDTKKILDRNWSKMDATPVPQSVYTTEKPNNIFASTDQVKTNHNNLAHSAYDGEFNSAHNVLGPSRIAAEETRSYAGNALVKMVALMMVSLQRLRNKETENDLLSVHDGGVCAFLLNKDGDRYTQLFTDEKFFPTSAKYMNSILAGPGVELAELYKSATSFRVVMDALHAKVADVCKNDPRFTPEDLCGVDTAIQMAIPAKDFFKLFDNYKVLYPHLRDKEICEGIALSHAVIVGETQKIKFLKEPQFNSEPLSLDTENYIEAEGHPGKSRAQVDEWVQTGPTAATYHALMEAVGAESMLKDGQKGYWREGKINVKIAVPGMLTGIKARASSNLKGLKSELNKHDIRSRMGTGYWQDFQDVNGAKKDAANDFNHAAHSHRQNIRKILKMHDFLYIPAECVPSTPREKKDFLLLIVSAMVQRQVLKRDAPYIIMEKGPLADEVIKIYKALKNAGLIGQRFEHLVKLTDNAKQSAAAIHAISRMKRPTTRTLDPEQENVLQLEMPKNYTVTIYCSASNKNALWAKDVKKYASRLALKGADLKIGGGNDGMMKEAADGYLAGLDQLLKQGEIPKDKLHLIQCDDTVTIEGDYEIPPQYKHLEKYIERRCYRTIEERRYDLQKAHMTVGGPGGLGTFEEIVCELIARDNNEKDLNLYLLSQPFKQSNSLISHVFDYLSDVMSLNHADAKVSHTVEELISITKNNIKSPKAAKMAIAAAATTSQFPALDVA